MGAFTPHPQGFTHSISTGFASSMNSWVCLSWPSFRSCRLVLTLRGHRQHHLTPMAGISGSLWQHYSHTSESLWQQYRQSQVRAPLATLQSHVRVPLVTLQSHVRVPLATVQTVASQGLSSNITDSHMSGSL